MNNNLQELLNSFSKELQGTANKASQMLITELEKGTKLDAAVKKIRKAYPDLFKLPQVNDLIVSAAVEGYGISANLITDIGKAAILTELSKPWDASGLALSKKLHGADAQIYSLIVKTLETQIRANKSVIEIARALYDGYNSSKTINVQNLPNYLKAFRHSMPDDTDMLTQARKATERIRALSRNGAPNQALAAAYKKLLYAANTGTEKALKNAVYVAVNEKSRYVAERIARTEAAKAWADGYFANVLQDKHVVGFKWKLSSRHPVYDICDMYAKADLFNLGAGVYPKDKVPPLPAHPHCLCRVVEVYRGEIDPAKRKDNTDRAVNEWLSSLPEDKRKLVLGVQGNKDWMTGDGWQDKLRGWQGLTSPTSRLSREFVSGLMSNNLFPPDDYFLQTIANDRQLSYTLGKEGYDRFSSDSGEALYPLNNGFVGTPITETLKKGSLIVDRYGGSRGSFVSPAGTPFAERALPKEAQNKSVHVYRINKDLPGVLSGRTAAWFEQPGGGWQYKLPGRVMDLTEYLEEV